MEQEMEPTLSQLAAAAPVSRRAFFKRIGVGFLATILITVDRTGILAQTTTKKKFLWTRAAFEPHVGERFTVLSKSGAKIKFSLKEILGGSTQVLTRAGVLEPARNGESFILVFSGPLQRPLSQDTYRFQHPELGKFSLFIVPGSATQKSQHYIAVVNRITA